jgi:hypothetical protein
MITIKDFMECVSYRITDGAEYQWEIFGPNAYCLDYWNGSHDDGISVSIVFDTKTQLVYEFQAWDYARGNEYRWIHPGYIEGYVAEAERRGVNYRQSYDDNEFTDLDVVEDILEKAAAIVNGEEYDNRIMVTLTLGDDEMYQLMQMAHEADLSLNKFVEHILKLEMQKYGIEV